MTTESPATPEWMPKLMDQVQQHLNQMSAGRHDQRPALEEELKQTQANVQGWSISLANSKLSAAVRESIETQWATALERQQEIEADLNAFAHEGQRAEQLVSNEQVRSRLDRLAEVLAANNPTRGNLELSMHIDRITCYRDDRVTLRMCKLGIMPNAVELFSLPTATTAFATPDNGTSDTAPPDTAEPVNTPVGSKPRQPRRRGKLRVVEDDGKVDLRAQANFIADTHRFAGLADEWFWLDTFHIPETLSWAAQHADAVFRRRQETRFPFSKLAVEFGVTPPTIGAAIRCYLKAHPAEKDEVFLQRGGKRRPKFNLSLFATEARQLWIEGWSKEKLAKKYGCSAPTVDKAIAYAYTQEGSQMPTRAEARSLKVSEARQLLDAGKSLDEIAATMKVSDVTARQLLRESFAAEGQRMPDLRRRKGA